MPSAALARPNLLAAAASHTGLQRENNEDRYHCDPQRGIFMVIDGVGGQAAGEKAADTALTMIRARLERETGSPAERVREAIALANNEIFRLAGTEPAWEGMACVLTVALVRDGRVTVGHVGDTRLYAFTRGRLAKVTHDHSPVGEREDRGDLDELEAMRHPRRNEIYRDVGSELHQPGDPGFIETIELPFEADSALVLCTDGLSDMIPSSRLARIVGDHAGEPSLVVERLVEAANAAGGKDNVTAVFVAGPGFAESTRGGRQPRGTGRADEGWTTSVAAKLKGQFTSWPAVVLYGVLAGLVLAAALMLLTDAVPGRLLDVARPAGWSRTWRVGSGSGFDFATIDDALARARGDDVVLVDPGTYCAGFTIPAGVSLVSRVSREAILSSLDTCASTSGITVRDGSRLVGFKVDSAGAEGVYVEGEREALVEDIEVTGSASAAVTFRPRSRGVLRASYLHDNAGTALRIEGQALPKVLHNVITGNGKAAPGGARTPESPAGAAAAAPAIVLADGASAVFFGNIIAGNASDEIAGLAPERRTEVTRDNMIGLPNAGRAGNGGRAPAAAGKPRRPAEPGR